jgi:hypothetical protein
MDPMGYINQCQAWDFGALFFKQIHLAPTPLVRGFCLTTDVSPSRMVGAFKSPDMAGRGKFPTQNWGFNGKIIELNEGESIGV